MTIDDEPPDSDDVELSRLRRWSTLTLDDEAALGPGSVRPAQGGNPAGRFLLADGRPAGEAGDSAVAYDTLLDRKVLLRFVVSSSGPPGTLAAVLREAAALARLSHANLIKVHDVGVLDGRPFVAVEMVQGVTLAAWGAERRRSDREIAEVVAAAASGLAAAHAHGVEHGALSPDSIVIQQGRVVVTGFDRRPASPPDLAADV